MTPEGLTALADIERPTNPFPGLRPFEFGESHLYFGRDGQSDQLIRKLSATRFVAVVGTSGSGKSSLVRAGLLPDLFGGFMSSAGSHWRVCLMRPSNDPLGNLARALNSTEVFGSEDEENRQIQTAITEATLRRGSLGLVEAVRQNRMASNESLLVVVDQFEELFRFARVSGSEQYRYEAAAFVKLLLEAARQREQNVYVVLTMRSDFLGDCSIFWGLPEAVNEGQYLIPRMTRDQRTEAITGPIAVCGGHIAQRLVNRLLNDTGDNPDMLPILQHALMRTWENWAADHKEGEPVDLRHYEAVGTMSDALSRHADEAFAELPDERSRLIAERVFKALTEKGEDNREVRRPTVLAELCAQTGATTGEVISVVEVFRREGRSFLMPPASVPLDEESLIDISHESLIRNWQRLKEWVDEESQSAQIYQRLAETAVLHERGRAGLWRDPDLQLALDWRERTRPTSAWAARYHPAFDPAMAFLDASVAARDAAALEEERRRRREIRRTRLAAVVFFLLFMLALAAFGFAYTKTLQAQEALGHAEESNRRAVAALAEAERERDRANEQTKAAQRSEEVAQGAKDEAEQKRKEAEESKAAAVKSAEVARLNARKAEESRLEAEKQKTEAQIQRAEAETQKKTAEAEAVRNRQLLYASDMTLAQQAYEVSNVRLASQLLSAHSGDGEGSRFERQYLSRLLKRETGSLSYFNSFTTLALTPDGRTLAVGRGDNVVLWDLTAQKHLNSVATGAYYLNAMALSPDGKRVVTSGVISRASGSTNVVSVADTTTRERTPLPVDGRAEVTSLAFSPDGVKLGVGYFDGRAELWDAASLKLERRFENLGSAASYMTFSPKGETLAVATVKGDVSVWGVLDTRFRCVSSILENASSVNAAAVSQDGTLLAAGRSDGTVKLIRLAPCVGTLLSVSNLLGTGKSPVRGVAFSPDSKLLAVAYEDSSIEVWDAGGRRKLATFRGHVDAVNSIFFMPDGQLLSGSDEGAIKRWDTAALLLEEAPLAGHKSRVNAVAFSADGRTLATGSNDKTVLLWDVETKRKLDAPALKYKGSVFSVAFSPLTGALAVGADDPPLSVWDAGVVGAQPKPLVSPGDPLPVHEVAYSPDGKLIVSAHNMNSRHFVRVWNAETGALIKEQEFPDRSVHSKFILSLAVSHDSKMIAIGFGDGFVEVWDIALTRQVKEAEERDNFARKEAGRYARPPAYSVAFSPDGKLVAAAMGDGEVRLLDLTKEENWVESRRGHNGEVFAVAFSPDGKTLATGGMDKAIKLWAVDSFKELFTLDGHEDAVVSLAFSPDGQTLASASADRTARLWRTTAVKAAGQ